MDAVESFRGTAMIKIHDSNGTEINPGDIIECPECPVDSAGRYHVCFASGPEHEPEIRDVEYNNIDAYLLWGRFYNIGHFTKHLDKLSNIDLGYYFGIDMDKARANRADVDIKESPTHK